MAKMEDLYPDLSADLSVFTLEIEHRNLSFSVDFIGLRRNFSLIRYFQEIISIVEKRGC